MSYLLLKSLVVRGTENTGHAASAVVVVALKTESTEIPGQISGVRRQAVWKIRKIALEKVSPKRG